MTLTQIEPPPAVNDHDLIERLTDVYTQAKEMKGQLTEEWKRNYRITMNRAAPAIPQAPGTRANETYATIDSRIGWMTDQEIQFSVTPACDPFSLWSLTAQTLGEQLEDVLNSVMRTDGWYAEIVKMLWDSAMYGSGYLKCVWDSGLADGLGNVALKHVSPWCLYIDPFATSVDDASYIYEVHTMTPAEIERRFPDTSREMTERVAATGDTSTDHIPPNQISSRLKQGQLIPVDAGQGPTTWGPPGNARTHTAARQRGVNVYEAWVRRTMKSGSNRPTRPKGTPLEGLSLTSGGLLSGPAIEFSSTKWRVIFSIPTATPTSDTWTWKTGNSGAPHWSET